MFDRTTLFNAARHSLFNGSLKQDQVDGINADLDYWIEHYPAGNLQHLAYILATDQHESASTMQPIPEYGGKERLRRMYDITGDRPEKARELGNVNAGDGAIYTGGKIQLTGRRNFRTMGQRLGIDLEGNPSLIYDLNVSTAVLIVGMSEGLFTGKHLGDYTDLSGNLDFVKARRIVNGTDKAEEIAALARRWLAALEAAVRDYTPENSPQQQANIEAENSPPTQFESPLPPDWDQYQQWVEQQRRKAMTKPKWQSKIIITAVATVGSIALTRLGIDLPPEQLNDAITAIATSGMTIVTIVRLFYTNKALR